MQRILTFLLLIGSQCVAQNNAGSEAAGLAEQGKCDAALRLIARDLDQIKDPKLKRRVGSAGVRCAVTLNRLSEATRLLAWLEQQFPLDPEVLFLATRVHSDLSLRSAQKLLELAPDSLYVIAINAEDCAKRGEWEKAIAEYHILLNREPEMPGIHARLGQLLMTAPATDTSEQEARKEFEYELALNPGNAGAEYFLGELARRAGHLPEAIEHYSRAAKLNPALAEAQFGLGKSLMDSDRSSDAIAPLETAAKLAPGNPAVHFALAHVYQSVGRNEDAAREFALQKTTAAKIQQTRTTLKRNASGVEPGNAHP